MTGRPSRTKNCSIAGRASRPVGERRHDGQPARFERRDHAVVVRGVAGEQVRAHQQQADGAARRRRAAARRRCPASRAGQARVVDADVGILDGRRGLQRAAQRARADRPRSGRRGTRPCARRSRPSRRASTAASGSTRARPARCPGRSAGSAESAAASSSARAPAVVRASCFGRSCFRSASAPPPVPSIRKLPMRVSRIDRRGRHRADHRVAGVAPRRRAPASTGWMWSSMNSIVAMTMSPRPMSAMQRSSASGIVPPLGRGVHATARARAARARSAACARSAALARWLSSVTMTTRTGSAFSGRSALWHRRGSRR